MEEIKKLKEVIRSYESEQDRLKENITAWKMKCDHLTAALEVAKREGYSRGISETEKIAEHEVNRPLDGNGRTVEIWRRCSFTILKAIRALKDVKP